jgi:hypothetical protein
VPAKTVNTNVRELVMGTANDNSIKKYHARQDLVHIKHKLGIIWHEQKHRPADDNVM